MPILRLCGETLREYGACLTALLAFCVHGSHAASAAPASAAPASDEAPAPKVLDDDAVDEVIEQFRTEMNTRRNELDVLEDVRRADLVKEMTKRYDHPDIADELAGYLRARDDAKIREAVARAFASWSGASDATRDHASLALLRVFSSESDDEVLEQMIRSLGTLRCERVVPMLERALREWNDAPGKQPLVEASVDALASVKSYEALGVILQTWVFFDRVAHDMDTGRSKVPTDRVTGAHAKKGSAGSAAAPNPLVLIPKIRKAVTAMTGETYSTAQEMREHMRELRAKLDEPRG